MNYRIRLFLCLNFGKYLCRFIGHRLGYKTGLNRCWWCNKPDVYI